MDILGLSRDAQVGRRLASALAENRMVALVADRDLTGRGVEVPMFGRPRRLPAGPALLSLTTGAPILVSPVYQIPGGWRIVFSAPLEIDATGERRRDVAALTHRMGEALRTRDLGRAGRLASVPAGLGAVRIALVCPYAWDEPGGVQVHVRELGERLRGRGHEVLGAHAAPAPVPASRGWCRSAGRCRCRTAGRGRPSRRGPARAGGCARPSRRFGADVVHVHEPASPSASVFALGAGAPLVATFHSGLDRALLYDAAAPLLRRAARRIAVRIAVSERAAAVARRRLRGTYRVIPNGVDVARFATRVAGRPRAGHEAAVRRAAARAEGVRRRRRRLRAPGAVAARPAAGRRR